jgi:hypothetical protein
VPPGPLLGLVVGGQRPVAVGAVPAVRRGWSTHSSTRPPGDRQLNSAHRPRRADPQVDGGTTRCRAQQPSSPTPGSSACGPASNVETARRNKRIGVQLEGPSVQVERWDGQTEQAKRCRARQAPEPDGPTDQSVKDAAGKSGRSPTRWVRVVTRSPEFSGRIFGCRRRLDARVDVRQPTMEAERMPPPGCQHPVQHPGEARYPLPSVAREPTLESQFPPNATGPADVIEQSSRSVTSVGACTGEARSGPIRREVVRRRAIAPLGRAGKPPRSGRSSFRRMWSGRWGTCTGTGRPDMTLLSRGQR